MKHTGKSLHSQIMAAVLCFVLMFPVGAAALSMTIPAKSRSPAVPVLPVAVFGKDERAPLDPAHAALDAKIGVLTLRGGATCTAFCAASDVIVTASHCLFGTKQSADPPALENMSFVVGSGSAERSSPLAGFGRSGMRRNIVSGTSHLSVVPPIDAENDWAVARLAIPVCSAGALPLTSATREEIEAKAAAGDVYQVGMHRDLSARTLVRATPCAISRAFPGADDASVAGDFADFEAVLLHTCDTGPGSSGSPLLIDSESGPEVAGLNVGTYVLSRMTEKDANGEARETSRPIANTAVVAARFREAVQSFAVLTGALPPSRPRASAVATRPRLARP